MDLKQKPTETKDSFNLSFLSLQNALQYKLESKPTCQTRLVKTQGRHHSGRAASDS